MFLNLGYHYSLLNILCWGNLGKYSWWCWHELQ